MKARRFFTALGIFAVTAVAGAISYRHQSALAMHHGQPHALAAVWPLCVDGLVMSCGIAIATDRATGLRPRPWALIGFWLGVAVSVATNWLATTGGLVAHGVSAFPAIAFLISVEALSSKPRQARVAQPQLVTVTVDEVAPDPITAPVVTAAPVVKPSRAVPATPRRSQSAAARVAAVARKLPDASPAVIAAKAAVSESTARRHLAAMVAAATTTPTPVLASNDLVAVAA